MRGSVAVLVQGFQPAEYETKDGVESRDDDARDDDERTATLRKDDAGYWSGEAIGARDCFGRG